MDIIDPNEIPAVDAEKLLRLLDIVRNHRDELSWILMQQEKLRNEYISFLKRDLRDLVSTQKTSIFKPNHFNLQISDIIATYRRDIEKSFKLLDSRFQELLLQSTP